MTIHYINTDLDLESDADLTGLVTALEASGLFTLYVDQGGDGRWHACFEIGNQYDNAEDNIAAILDVIDRLGGTALELWQGCSVREVNPGFEVRPGAEVFGTGLSNLLLHRIAGAGASLRFTVYPVQDEEAV